MAARDYDTYADAPAWLRAADSHNAAAHNTSFFDDVMDKVSRTPDFVRVSAASAANSFYNSGLAVTNVFRGLQGREDLEYRDTGKWISDMDDDLGEYYEENKDMADLAGFIGGSFIPGLGGVRLLGAGQKALTRAAATGEVGSNLSRATGLLAPSMQSFVRKNAADLASRSGQWSLWSKNSLQTIRAGAQQGILEGIAFEGAVMASMFKSPVFEDMDVGDMVANMGIGVVLGGAVGTLIGGATSYFGTSRLIKQADARQVSLATGTRKLPSASPISDNIVHNASEASTIGKKVTADDVLELKIKQGESGESISPQALEAEANHLNYLREQNLRRLAEERRMNIRKLSGDKNNDLANQVADMADLMEPADLQATFLNMQQIVRASEKTDYDRALKQLMKEGNMDRKQAQAALEMNSPEFIQLHSGNIGGVMESGPASFMRLADKMTPDGIKKYVRKRHFQFKKAFDYRTAKSGDEVEARWLWARDSKVGIGALPFPKNFVAGSHDLPILEKAVRDRVSELNISLPDGELSTLRGVDEIADYYKQAQLEVAQAAKEAKRPTGFIERVSNIRKDYLEGASKHTDDYHNFNAQQSYAEDLSKFYGTNEDALSLHYKPKYAKVQYDRSQVLDDDGNILRGMQQIKYREKLAKEQADRVFEGYAGPDAEVFQNAPDELIRRAWRGGKGSGLFTNAGGQYGSVESWASHIGNLVSGLKKRKITKLQEDMQFEISQMLTSPQDAVRFSAINETISAQAEKFVLNADGTALVPRKIRDYELALEAGENPKLPELAQGTPETIPLETDAIRAIVRKHIDLNAARNTEFGKVRAAQGLEDKKYTDTFYPVRQDPRQFKHVMFVKDNSLSGVGHTRMIIARSAEELEQLRNKVPSQYQTYTKGDGDRFFQARGEWEYDKTLHENYLDTDLNSRGIRSSFFPQSDPKVIADTWVQDQIRKENTLLNEMVSTKYQKEVAELRKLGELFSDVAESSTAHISTLAMSRRKNPYNAQIKSMLDITKVDEHPWLMNTQQMLDEKVTAVWNRAVPVVRGIFQRGKNPTDLEINQIEDIFNEVGFKSAYYDSTLQALANSPIPRGALTGFVRKANAFLTTTILRFDPFNALNNLLGNNVIMSAEVKAITSALKVGDTEAVGDLARLAQVKIPGQDAHILSGPKLIANSLRRLHGPQREQLLAQYRAQGLLPDLTDQYYRSLDAITLTGMESAKDLNSKWSQLSASWKKLETGGTKLTGNAWAEQFNRLIAADVMKQITEVGIKHGVLDEKMAWSYVNTMVNRVNGVVRAAERPLMFQGPVGQAMGLFQSYQFNLIQQTLRHVGEGRGKSVAMLAGMQTSIYGASSLPGFSMINNSLIGNASGNPDHQDVHSLSQVAFGREGADWLLYGAPSNILGAALYSRGNTNPRTWHVVPNPTNPTEIPFISGFTKFAGSFKQAADRVAEGAPVWESFLSGVEHMGLSRPMAGIAATARAFTNESGEVYSTQRSGNFLASHDLMSMATLMRIAGAKPIDEAIMQNDYFRIRSYAEADRAKRDKIGEALRTAIQAEGNVESSAIESFAEQYVRQGGNAANFNKYMLDQYKNATVSQAEQMARNLNSPYGRAMQQAMGGRDFLSDIDSF